jgi:hypothetical protein
MKKTTLRSLLLVGLILLVALGFYLLTRPQDVAKAIQKTDIQKDIARFTPHENLDIAMAMKIITHDPPKMLNPPSEIPPLVLYPPGEDELKRLTGE